ncbi:MAG TPA: hypothetical protein VJ455_10565 [Ignavibacteria bacterium]|nr:hypothetical protein [Ignavibacteria bacterium]
MKRVLFLVISSILFLSISSYSQIDKKVKITNKSGQIVTSVRLSSNNEYSWSLSVNTMEKVPIDQSFNFTWRVADTAKCIYDLKFTTDAGTDYIMEDLMLCEKSPIIELMIPEMKEPEKKEP